MRMDDVLCFRGAGLVDTLNPMCENRAYGRDDSGRPDC